MTLAEFVLLNECDQAYAIWDGAHLADRVSRGLCMQLYAVDAFYVEISYNPKENNRIIRVRPFANRRLLTPYLKNVALSEIIALL